jgi:hypothetical protein
MNKPFIYIAVLIIIATAGIQLTKPDDIIIMPPAGTTNIYNNYTNTTTTNGSNYSTNVSGQPPLWNYTTIICTGNTTCTQDTLNKTINITSTGGGSGGVTNESVNPWNLNAYNLTSGKVPIPRLNVSTCNVANEASTFNGTGWECISVASAPPETDPIAMAALPAKADGTWLNLTALPLKADGVYTNATAINNRNWAQLLFDLFNLTFARQDVNNTNFNNSLAGKVGTATTDAMNQTVSDNKNASQGRDDANNATKLNNSGGTITGNINMTQNQIINLSAINFTTTINGSITWNNTSKIITFHG